MMPRSNFTKKCLADALLKLIKKGVDIDSISIQDIVEEAGFSRMAYYRNFKEKGDIMRYYFDSVTEEFIKRTNTNFFETPFDKYLVYVFAHLFSHRDLAALLIKTNMFDYVKEQFDLKLIKEARTNEEKQRYIFFAGGLFNVYYHWLINGAKETPEEMASIISNYISKP